MGRAGQASYKRAVKVVKDYAKTDYPIRIRREKISEEIDGYCTFMGDHYLIQINRKLPYYFAIDVLLHEAAHAMAWDKDKDDHGLNWGKAYSKIYRIFLQQYYDQK